MSMPDPQLKRKLKKREQSRLRVLNKKNEGNSNLIFVVLYFFINLLISVIDASDEDEHEVATKEENVDETERKF